jgi:hypothetical protein
MPAFSSTGHDKESHCGSFAHEKSRQAMQGGFSKQGKRN